VRSHDRRAVLDAYAGEKSGELGDALDRLSRKVGSRMR
jgi:hypothetical protein